MVFFLISLLFFQYGKNKIQYQDFSFYYLEGEKFLLYYEEGSEELANFAYQIAEKTIEEYEDIFNFKLKRKIPIIVYNSPNQFQQTNIILDLLEEGVLGFAEMFKNRVVLPFTGSYYDFLYVLRHEIAHIFEYDYYWRRGLSTLLSLTPEFTLPTWFMEGLSEYLSKRRNSLHPIIIADLLINDKFTFLSSLPEESYLNYVLGEHFFIFLEERYSDKKVYDFLREVKKRKGIDGAVKKSFGKSFSSLEKDFSDYLKEKYYPLINKKTNFVKKAKIIVDHQKEKRKYNTLPIPISETEFIYLSYRDNQVSIFSYSFLKERSKILLKGVSFLGRGEISILKPALTYSPLKNAIYYIKKLEGKVYLCEYSLKTKKEEKYYLPLEDAYHLALSPDNKKIALCGIKRGMSNLYLFDLEKKELTILNSDIFEEKDPYFFNNDTLLFISDREELGNYQIYLYSLREKSIKKIFDKKTKELSSVIPLSKNSLDTLLFILNHSLVIYSLREDKILYQSDFLGSCQTPRVYKDKILFSYYHNQGYSICQIDNIYSLIEEKEFKKEKEEISEFSYPETTLEKEKKRYTFSLSADYAMGQAFFSTGLGLSGNILVYLSDLLGNHRFLILTNLYGLIDFSNFYFSYGYLKRREDYYFTIFQFVNFYSSKPDTFLTITKKGISPLLSYPFTKFLRTEFGLLLYLRDSRFYYQKEGLYEIEDKRVSERFLYTYSSLVFDNALFSYFGPIKGQRFLLQPYITIPPSDSIFQSLYLETRNYLNLYNNSYILALLFGGITSFGKDKERFYPDGDYVRGYPQVYPEEEETNPYLIFGKLEFRYPFIEILKLGFPLPITIKNIRGNTFLDFGSNFKKSIWGVGLGLRFFIGYFPFMIDFAYPLSLKKEERKWQITFGIKEDW
ncbi:MAG: BamA/TamA family outer membrane protein [candidate division WOR-3 bacterium]|nr:BamA/TamA family outer membrane protein [candidate division WOR-3 bacterium]